MFKSSTSQCLALVFALSSTLGAAAGQGAADKIIKQVLSEAKTNSTRAVKLLEAGRMLIDQPEVCGSILEKAVMYGTKTPVTPAGCQAASEALDILRDKLPDRKEEWTLKQLDVHRIRYRYSRTREQKQEAGGTLLTALATAARTLEANKDWAKAALRYREALVVDGYLKSGMSNELRAELKTATHFTMITRRVTQYAASLKKDPSKASTRSSLIKTLVVELDDPKTAAQYLSEDVDELWRTYVPLAAKDIDAVPEATCLELGQWYCKDLSKTPSTAGKTASLRRAQKYYKRFMELHTTTDIQTFRAKAALTDVEKQLAKFEAPAPIRVRKSPGGTNRYVTLSLGSGVGMKLIKISAGRFSMSSPESEKGRLAREGKRRIVTIGKSFYIGASEVTQRQWRAVMGTEPWAGRMDVKSHPDNAASYISWRDAEAFCGKLSKTSGKRITLPTEAQWEYACRAGTQTAFCFGNDHSQLGVFGWFGIKKNPAESYAHPVARKKPNAWGLYDMHGNVYEWCFDWYDENYYAAGVNIDPRGPESGRARVVRGGSFKEISNWCRSSHRHMYKALDRNSAVGFRVVVLAR